MTDTAPVEYQRPPPSSRTDLWTAAVLLAFGLAIVRLAVAMPTFIERGGDPFTAPGIVPGFYGTVIAVLSIVLAARSIARGALRPGGGDAAPGRALPPGSATRLAIATGICLLYTIVLIGRLPFWLASALFVAAFVILFEWQAGEAPAGRARRIATAALLGVATGVAVVLVFEKLFLVRLP